jgi:rhodanese-related sulfurtransferase
MKKTTLLLAALVLLALVVGTPVFAEGMTAQELVAEAKSQIQVATVEQVKGLFDQGGYVFVDVRESNETAMGQIPGALLIPRGLLEFQIASKVEDKNAQIVVYCKTGGRSSLATYTLKRRGYPNILSMDGGWAAWEAAGYPVE